MKNWKKKASLIFEEKVGSCEPVREVEDCPSPLSDNEAVSSEAGSNSNRFLPDSDVISSSPTPDTTGDMSLPVQKMCKLTDFSITPNTSDTFLSMLETLEETFKKVLADARAQLHTANNGTTTDFYNRWLEMDSYVRKVCDANLSCSSSSSKPTQAVSSTVSEKSSSDSTVEMNGYNNQSSDNDMKSKKRKCESQDKDKDGNDECKNGAKSDEEEDVGEFNDDLICPHGTLTLILQGVYLNYKFNETLFCVVPRNTEEYVFLFKPSQFNLNYIHFINLR